MEQKHAMLYPDPNSVSVLERHSASEALGLPIEPPPSYAAAISIDQNHPSQQFAETNNLTFTRTENVVLPNTTNSQPPTNQPVQMTPSTQTTITMPASFQKLGPNPCSITCPTCKAFGTTRMTHTPNLQTHIAAGILCLVSWCCCACIIPYCTNSCRTGNHYCAHCNAFLGTHNSRIIG